VLPVPPLIDETAPVVFVYWPEDAPVTVMLNWHWPFAAIVAPVITMPVGAVVITVPPQTEAVAFATVRPVGSVSVKATPVSDIALADGFVIVKVKDVVPVGAMPVGMNTVEIEGGATTLIDAVAVAPVPPSVELIAPVVLTLAPAVVPVTLTEKVQEPLAAIVPADRLTAPPPAAAVIGPVPHEPVSPFGVATTKPAGNVSVKATPVATEVALLFCTVKLKLVEPLSGTLAAPNDFVRTGAPITDRDAFEVLPVPASVEVMVTELFLTPAVVPVMLTETTQVPLAGRVPAERLTAEAPAVAVTVPPQVFESDGVVATTNPAGKLSVNASPVSARLVFGLLMLNVSEVVPPVGTDAAPNALVMDGGVATVRFAVAVLPVPPLVEVIAPVVFVN
jgi:hypothetical protein